MLCFTHPNIYIFFSIPGFYPCEQSHWWKHRILYLEPGSSGTRSLLRTCHHLLQASFYQRLDVYMQQHINIAFIFRKLILDTSYDVKPVQMNLLGDGYKEMAVMGSGSSSEGDSKVWMVLCVIVLQIRPNLTICRNLTWSFTIIWRTGAVVASL